MKESSILSYRPQPGEYAWTFGGVPPVRTVRPGTVLELFTEDAFGGRVRGISDLVTKVCQFPFVNPQTGPFYVDGAHPGDTLAVHFVSIEPARDWAASTTIPLFGALTSTHLTATLQEPLAEVVWMYEVDRAGRTVRYRSRYGDHTTELPLDPMHGTVGVAPASLEARSSLVPDAHGGNMDTPEMRAGTTCFLGVNVDGALLSLGDGHCRAGPLACPACGHEPATRGETLQQREDLAIIWLHLDGDHLTEARHCVACQPHEPVIDVSCSCCGDGPLITEQPPELGDQLAPPALDWMHSRGWQLHPQPLCPADHR